MNKQYIVIDIPEEVKDREDFQWQWVSEKNMDTLGCDS